MSDTKMSQLELFRKQYGERVRQAQIDQHAQRIAAEEAKAERIRAAELQAESRLADATFREIFYTHDNVIHTYRPDRTRSVLFRSESGQVIHNVTEQPAEAARLAQLKSEIETAERSATAAQGQVDIVNKDIAEARGRPIVGDLHISVTLLPRLKAAERRLRDANTKLERLRSEHDQLAEATTIESFPVNAAVGDVAVDTAGRAAYWARWAGPFSVSRHLFGATAGDDGTSKVIYPNRPSPVTSVALQEFTDGSDPMLYWLEGDRSLMRGSIDGSAEAELLLDIEAPGQGGLWQVVIDSFQQRIYWTNTISIWRADLGDSSDLKSSAVMVISPSESPHPIDLAVDGANGTLYWIDRDLKMLRTSDLDGNDVKDLYPIERPFRGLEIDRHTGMVYWADEIRGSRWIRRGTTDNRNLIFDGSSDFIDLGRIPLQPAPGAAAPFTVHLWFDVSKTRTGSRQTLISRCSSDGTIHFGVFLRNDMLEIVIDGGSTALQMPDIAKGPQQLTIAIGDKDGRVTINFLDNKGVHWGIGLLTRHVEPPRTSNSIDGRWLLGASHGTRGPKEFFDGSIWEASMWTGAQTAAQMRVLREGRPTDAVRKRLVGRWRGGHRIGRLVPNVAPNGTAGWWRTKRFDDRVPVPAMRFGPGPDGSEPSRVEMPAQRISLRAGFTFETWVHASAAPYNHTVADFVDTTSGARLAIGLRQSARHDGGDPYQVYISSQMTDDAQPVEIAAGRVGRDRWIHIAVSCGADGKPSFFVDGTEATFSSQKRLPLVEFTTDTARLGVPLQETGGREGFSILDGMLSDIRIWDGRIGADLIAQRRHLRLVGNEPGLSAYWPLEERSGATLIASPTGASAVARIQAVPNIWRVERGEIDHAMLEATLRIAAIDVELVALDVVDLNPFASDAEKADAEARRRALHHERAELRMLGHQLNGRHQGLSAAIAALDPWVLVEVPIARRDVVDRRVTEVCSVPGSDGLTILFTAQYAAARKQQAQAALRLAREQADADLARVRTEAAVRRDILEMERAAKLLAADADKRAALHDASTKRQHARTRESAAAAAGERRKGAAVAQGAAITARSADVAEGAVRTARNAKAARVGKARSDRDAKSREVNAAKRRR